MKKPSDYLKQGWCQNDSAQDANGNTTRYFYPEAARWCSTGALCRTHYDYSVNHNNDMGRFLQWRRRLDEAIQEELKLDVECISGLIAWNDADGRTQAEVIALFERAEAKAGDL